MLKVRFNDSSQCGGGVEERLWRRSLYWWDAGRNLHSLTTDRKYHMGGIGCLSQKDKGGKGLDVYSRCSCSLQWVGLIVLH